MGHILAILIGEKEIQYAEGIGIGFLHRSNYFFRPKHQIHQGDKLLLLCLEKAFSFRIGLQMLLQRSLAAPGHIILDFLYRVDSTTTAANSTKDMAKSAYNGSKNWIPYLYHVTYSPTRIDHKVLSLFGNNVVYNGAGHPEKTCVSASYDLLSGDVLTLASIMNKNATVQQFYDLVIEELAKKEKASHLYDNYQATVQARFSNTDPANDELWYFTQTGLCFYFAPYEIAPYTSGVITVEIPYQKLTSLVHEAYLPLARNSTQGKIKVSSFEQVDLSNFAHIAEIITEKETKMYMLHTDEAVQDVRIAFTDKTDSYTVFAAYNLIPGNGIMIQGNENTLKSMKITYKSGGQTITEPII